MRRTDQEGLVIRGGIRRWDLASPGWWWEQVLQLLGSRLSLWIP